MLLDQKRTKRMVVVVSIICAVAFVGVLPVVLGLVVFGDSGANDGIEQVVSDAENRVAANPNDVEALVDLSVQYRAANRLPEAAETLQKAVTIGPANTNELQLLVGSLSDQPGQQIEVLKVYTTKNPRDADAWFTYGSTAEQIGQVVTARLAYQRAARVAPADSTIRTNAQTALERLRDAPAAPTPTQPNTSTAPATPATPATP